MTWLAEQRRLVSLLLANGHPDASDYSLGVMWTEARFVQGRDRSRIASEAVVLYQIVQTAFGDKKAHKALQKHIDNLLQW